LYSSLKQGDIIYNSKYISDIEMKEFDMICKDIHKNINEPHKLHRIIKHCERIRSNGSWESYAPTKGDVLKYRRDILKRAEATGWKVIRHFERQGKGIKRGTLVTYTLAHPSCLVDNIVLDCKYDDKEKLDFYRSMLKISNDIIEEIDSLVEKCSR
jgi:hypothetical protein